MPHSGERATHAETPVDARVRTVSRRLIDPAGVASRCAVEAAAAPAGWRRLSRTTLCAYHIVARNLVKLGPTAGTGPAAPFAHGPLGPDTRARPRSRRQRGFPQRH